MLCSGNIDDDSIYPDKLIVFSNKTAKEFIKEETCSSAFRG